MSARTTAIRTLIYQGRKEQGTKLGYRETKAALVALGLTVEEQEEMLEYMGFHDREGKPHAYLTTVKPRRR